MMLYSQRKVRAQIVPLRRRSRIAAGQMIAAVNRVVRDAGAQGKNVSKHVHTMLVQCAEAAVPQFAIRPALESLESRTLLSSVTLSSGVLTLTGDAGAGNSLTVDLQSNGGYWANADGHTLSTNPGAVSRISITGGSGSDLIYINHHIRTNAII